MSTPEIFSLSLSIFSLLIAVLAAYYSYQLGTRQIHITARHEFLRVVLDTDKELIRDPSLWGVFDGHPMAKLGSDDPAHQAKLEAFVWMKLNLFYRVFIFFQETHRTSDTDHDFFATWDAYLRDSLATCRRLRDLVARPTVERWFGAVHRPRPLASSRDSATGPGVSDRES